MTDPTRTNSFDRRRFLAVSGGAALALILGGVGLAVQPGVPRQPRVALQVLGPRAFSVLAAIADRICPGSGGLPNAWELNVPEDIDGFLATCDPAVGVELEQGLLLIENGLPGLLLDLQPRPFSARSAAAQDATLIGMSTSRLALRRTLYKALVGLVTSTYWGHPEAGRRIGYQPPDFS